MDYIKTQGTSELIRGSLNENQKESLINSEIP